jgi:hypothetical protein
VAGYTRFNTTTTLMEVFNGTIWTSVGAPPNAGLGLNLSGVSPNEILKVSIPQQVTPPVVGTGTLQAIDGSMYWDSTLAQLFIRYNNGGTPAWVAAAPPGGGGSTLTAASAAEAAAGTLTTKYSSPATAVPKDASGMTGAGILPSGTTAQRPATPAAGMLRYNSTGAFWEGRIGSNWAPFDQRFPVVTAVSATVNPEDYVVVTAATQTITLPATPLPGACVTVVVAGTWLDTVVARNGSNIMGLAQDLTLNIANAALQFTYTDATNGWRVN